MTNYINMYNTYATKYSYSPNKPYNPTNSQYLADIIYRYLAHKIDPTFNNCTAYFENLHDYTHFFTTLNKSLPARYAYPF